MTLSPRIVVTGSVGKKSPFQDKLQNIFFCRDHLFKSWSAMKSKACPVCKEEVSGLTPCFQFGVTRDEYLQHPREPGRFVDIPQRPARGEDPFVNLDLTQVRRSARMRTTNVRLSGAFMRTS